MRSADKVSGHRDGLEVRLASIYEAEEIALCLALAFEPYQPHYTAGAFADTVPTADGIRRRMEQMKVYVAIASDGVLAGTLAAQLVGDEGHLRGMAVRPRFQGHSVAQRLLVTAERDLAASGARCITLDTTALLERAARFYLKNGYVRSGRVTDFFGMPLYEYLKELPRAPGSKPGYLFIR